MGCKDGSKNQYVTVYTTVSYVSFDTQNLTNTRCSYKSVNGHMHLFISPLLQDFLIEEKTNKNRLQAISPM